MRTGNMTEQASITDNLVTPHQPSREPEVAEPSGDWGWLASLRPAVDPSSRFEVELSQPVRQRRLGMSRRAALHMIFDTEAAHTQGLWEKAGRGNGPAPDGLDLWIRRGWRWAASYYVASRDIRFADRNDPDASVRRQKLTEYLQQSPPPEPRHRVDDAESIVLPPPADLSVPLGQVLLRRRSMPRPPARTLPLDKVSTMLWHACGRARAVRRYDPADPVTLLRSFATALDVWLAVYDVDGLDSGIYRYDMESHNLRQLAGHPAAELRELMQQILIGQPAPRTASLTVLEVADFARYQWRYRHERALRHLYLDSAKLMSYLILSATALNMRTQITPAVQDRLALKLLEHDPRRHQVLYTISVS